MPKTLSKVTKNIKAKKDGKGVSHIHPGSRDHKRLNRAHIREERLQKQQAEKNKAKYAELNRLYFFQDALKESQVTSLMDDDVRALIHKYIHRDDGERERLANERRPGRPPSSKEDQYRRRFELEEDEFRTGFHIPDFMDSDNVARFVAWDGQLGSLPLIKFIRVTRGT